MKCQACNAHLSIEDEKCPYCGTPNPEAVQHRKDMLRFSKEFQATRSSVLRMASERAGKSARIITLCIMGLLLVLSILFYIFSWDISHALMNLQASSNTEKYCAQLDQYEEDRDYLAFAALYEQRSLYGIDAFDEYRYVYDASSSYAAIYNSITSLLEEEPWEDSHERSVESLCDSLEYHYKYIEGKTYDYLAELGAYDEVHLNTVSHITEKIENLIQLTFAVSEEDMEQFKEMSPIEKQIFIERRFQDYE